MSEVTDGTSGGCQTRSEVINFMERVLNSMDETRRSKTLLTLSHRTVSTVEQAKTEIREYKTKFGQAMYLLFETVYEQRSIFSSI